MLKVAPLGKRVGKRPAFFGGTWLAFRITLTRFTRFFLGFREVIDRSTRDLNGLHVMSSDKQGTNWKHSGCCCVSGGSGWVGESLNVQTF
jgi:hypothetical protein